jgi:diacylglycerol kinase family enzyme
MSQAVAPESGVPARPIPVFVNPNAGSAAEVDQALEGDPAFGAHVVPDPARLCGAIEDAIESGATRVVVAGGDGSIATAAGRVAGRDVELAVLPAGTLNHFAKFLDVPDDLKDALRVARDGVPRRVDAAFVNDRFILNTSSVGAYVTFVRARERLERLGVPYRIASLIAFARVLLFLRTFRLVIEAEGARRIYHTPLVFIGVGERELTLPGLGSRTPNGRRGLHVIVIRGKGRARLLLLAVAVAARGLHALPRRSDAGIDSFVVDRCRMEARRTHITIGIDGELAVTTVPLEYRLAPDALRVVGPPENGEPGTGNGEPT